MATLKYSSTKDIKVPEKLIDQVIGQDMAVKVIKKAAEQRRHVLLIGEPGTGKSMLGIGLAELLPKEKLVDIISFPNPNDDNTPLIRTVPAGKGREIVMKARIQGQALFKNQNIIFFILFLVFSFVSYYLWKTGAISDVIYAASLISLVAFLGVLILGFSLGNRMSNTKVRVPKLIVDNFNKKQAPFYDATGAHAGALLGDVLHDPFQTFSYPCIQKCILKGNIYLGKKLEHLFDKFKDNIEKRKEKNEYEAIHLPKNELLVLGEKNGSVLLVEVLSSNRYDYDGKMIKLITSENKELIVTPEHKIAVNKNGKIDYKEAKYLKIGDEVISKSQDIIVDEQDIINTYNERQQQQCRLYYEYLDIKAKNPSWGYKRIAKAMDQKIGKTRWWHAKKHIPVPIQTANWLRKKGLLPLRADNPKLPLIAKVLGATFGDGGIFDNLNGIFLSSKERYNIEEFGKDIETIFNLKQEGYSRIIEGGEFGHSWCYQNTNRNIIRLFIALGSPVGKKSSQELNIPSWIYMRDDLKREFFGSLFWTEAGIPKRHVSKTQLNTFDFAVTGEQGMEKNRVNFLKNIKDYLNSIGIKTGRISRRLVNTKYSNKKSILYRFLISTEFQNLIHFSTSCRLNYCKYKRDKLTYTMNKFKEEKRRRYNCLISEGLGAESAMKVLNLTPSALYEILNDTKFIVREPKVAYG